MSNYRPLHRLTLVRRWSQWFSARPGRADSGEGTWRWWLGEDGRDPRKTDRGDGNVAGLRIAWARLHRRCPQNVRKGMCMAMRLRVDSRMRVQPLARHCVDMAMRRRLGHHRRGRRMRHGEDREQQDKKGAKMKQRADRSMALPMSLAPFSPALKIGEI